MRTLKISETHQGLPGLFEEILDRYTKNCAGLVASQLSHTLSARQHVLAGRSGVLFYLDVGSALYIVKNTPQSNPYKAFGTRHSC